jgi:hypothetical protein
LRRAIAFRTLQPRPRRTHPRHDRRASRGRRTPDPLLRQHGNPVQPAPVRITSFAHIPQSPLSSRRALDRARFQRTRERCPVTAVGSRAGPGQRRAGEPVHARAHGLDNLHASQRAPAAEDRVLPAAAGTAVRSKRAHSARSGRLAGLSPRLARARRIPNLARRPVRSCWSLRSWHCQIWRWIKG